MCVCTYAAWAFVCWIKFSHSGDPIEIDGLSSRRQKWDGWKLHWIHYFSHFHKRCCSFLFSSRISSLLPFASFCGAMVFMKMYRHQLMWTIKRDSIGTNSGKNINIYITTNSYTIRMTTQTENGRKTSLAEWHKPRES